LNDTVVDSLIVAALGLVAVGLGGPLTMLVFGWVDGSDSIDADGPRTAGVDTQVLRGGAWIGALERAAVFATILARFPEGLALVLAVKGFGRYPELRENVTGAAEKFIIGTLVSVLFSCGCAGVAWWLVHR